MSHVFPRHTKSRLATAVAGDGPYVIDADGKRYLDGCGGAAVSCLGHNNEVVREAEQAHVPSWPRPVTRAGQCQYPVG